MLVEFTAKETNPAAPIVTAQYIYNLTCIRLHHWYLINVLYSNLDAKLQIYDYKYKVIEFNNILGASGKQNLVIDKDFSEITNEELVTPSSLSSLKSCNENPAQDDSFEATIDKENVFENDKTYRMSQDEASNQDKIDAR